MGHRCPSVFETAAVCLLGGNKEAAQGFGCSLGVTSPMWRWIRGCLTYFVFSCSLHSY